MVTTCTQNSSTTTTTFSTITSTTLSPTIVQGSDVSVGLSTQQQQQQQSQQLGIQSVQHMHPPIFSQGVQLRAPQGSSGIVFQMPSGSYTYVHPCVGQTVGTNNSQHQQHQSSAKTTSLTQIGASSVSQSKNKQTLISNDNEPVVTVHNENVPVSSSEKESQQATSSLSSLSVSTRNTEILTKNVKEKGKHVESGRKTNAVKIATPQPITPTNLVPVGAPVPMMVMSAAMSQLGSFGGPATVPFMGPNGQMVHQQFIANASVPTHQMIPVFHHQQQSNFAVSRQPSSQINNTNSQGYHNAVVEDDTGYVDSGIENEPPPLLIQNESKDSLDIHMLFTKEAEKYYQCAGRRGKVIHIIEGFQIEESGEPFACDPPSRLSDWIMFGVEEKNRKKGPKENARSTSRKKAVTKNVLEAQVEVRHGKMETRKGRTNTSPLKSEAPSGEANKKARKRKTNELDRLLQMDFGPSNGRLCDILQKAAYKSPKENKEFIPPPQPLAKGKSKERPISSSIDKQKTAKAVINEPVMEKFIIEDSKDVASKNMIENEEENAGADQSLNSSKSSADTIGGSVLATFSDEELDTERCNYCNGLLRLKRLENHPQYCSKKCRKLWKKNPAISEDQVAGCQVSALPRLPLIRPTETSLNNKDISSIIALQNLTIVSEPCSSGTNSTDLQQRSPPTLTLKMVSPQQAEIVKSPRNLSTNSALGENNKTVPISVSPVASSTSVQEEKQLAYLSRPTKTWTCDEVANWVSSVTGNEDCANTFRNQDIDGQSLLLLPDNAHNNLVTLLGLKLGPVVKILNALKELSSKSMNIQ
ncbi:unnamed protein product [Thelazia callipaeda]|uniref:SAM domain-containing protein n=1 Tax=Thelazia callipaeda TaxID=103827 RepID=A0A0N5DB64_THECL|nr:unnamed protein product [Thelazia callipaeda]